MHSSTHFGCTVFTYISFLYFFIILCTNFFGSLFASITPGITWERFHRTDKPTEKPSVPMAIVSHPPDDFFAIEIILSLSQLVSWTMIMLGFSFIIPFSSILCSRSVFPSFWLCKSPWCNLPGHLGGEKLSCQRPGIGTYCPNMSLGSSKRATIL